jgi:predicted ATPase/DNA-binding SARP family transcriptional activator
MEFRILGPLAVSHEGSLLAVGGPRHRRLLAALLVGAGSVVSRDRLTEALWGEDPPRSASAMLHVRVSELRAALRAGRPERDAGLLTVGGGYLLDVGDDGLDARRFERLAVRGHQVLGLGEHARAAAELGDALALWRGPALVDVAGEPFAQAEAARLEALRVQALEDRLDADLAGGRHAEILLELEAMVGVHPLREPLWCRLMLALYRSGRQADALGAYQRARDLLADELGVEPGAELRRLQTAVLRQDPSLDLRAADGPVTMNEPSGPEASGRTSPRGDPPHNLPAPLTSFIGRERELAETRALLQAGRLVTLTGTGGSGKSRLAIETATMSLPDHPDGTWLVELAELHDPDLVPHAVAGAIGVRELPRNAVVDLLAERLRTSAALLVLDNCEHLLGGVAGLVHRLLGACPSLHILVTSRERLGITGEVLRRVDGLSVPVSASDRASVGEADAVQLFLERAAAVEAGFRLSDTNSAAVAQLCRRLDGLPLAIEMAAACVNTFAVDELAARLDDRFRILVRGSRTGLARHQTLRAMVDWSYGLLTDAQRRLFDRLAVFVGGFTFEAAEQVGSAAAEDRPAVAEFLARLVDTSMVVAESAPDGTHRYRIPETLRAYGLERLAEAGEVGRTRDRHGAFFLALAEPVGEPLRAGKTPASLHRLAVEHGNFRAALEWSLSAGDTQTAVRLAGALYPFWDLRGHYTEGRRWLEAALAADGPVPPAATTRALLGVATLAVIQGDLGPATAAANRATVLCRRSGDHVGLAHALQHLGFAAIHAGDLDRATALLTESLSAARAVGHSWLEGWSLLFLAIAAVARAEYGEAARLSRRGEAVLRPVDEPEGMAWAMVIQGAAAWRDGDQLRAATALRDGLRAFQGLGGSWGLSVGLLVSAQVAGTQGNRHASIVLSGASEALRLSVGAALLPFVQEWLDTARAEASAELDAGAVNRAWRTGQQLPTEEAVGQAVRALDAAARCAGAVA